MKTKLFVVFGVLILMLSSCKKKEFTFTLKGSVDDKTFSTALVGAKIYLEEVIPGSTSEPIIHETTVASDGSYEFTFARNKATEYIVTIVKQNYFDIVEHISFSDFSTEEPLVKNFETTAMAWVKLIFNNVAPSAIDDDLRYTKQQGKVSCSMCCPTSEQHIYGLGQQSVICVNDGNTSYSYLYFSTNPVSNGIEEIYTPAFDTVELIKNW
ncbi:MAG: hypothetical protein ACK5B9_11735 [Flavobacteriia bacterium]|jgi:hypothetical protein